jgi:hypothetical protein
MKQICDFIDSIPLNNVEFMMLLAVLGVLFFVGGRDAKT